MQANQPKASIDQVWDMEAIRESIATGNNFLSALANIPGLIDWAAIRQWCANEATNCMDKWDNLKEIVGDLIRDDDTPDLDRDAAAPALG